MYHIVMVIHVLAAVCLIGLVLIQQGKGATIGAAFGSGASQTVFGSRGSGSFLLRVTIGFVIVFFATSMALNYMATQAVKQSNQVVLPLTAPAKDIAPPVNIPSNIPLPGEQTKSKGT